jgi:hypothetical protein
MLTAPLTGGVLSFAVCRGELEFALPFEAPIGSKREDDNNGRFSRTPAHDLEK